MLGILLGVDDGLLEVIPGSDSTRGITGSRITSLDYYDGVAIAGAPDDGAWVHAGRRWERKFEGDVRSVRVAPDGRLFVGLEPAALHVSTDKGVTWTELEALRNIARHSRFAIPPGHKAPYVTGVAFPKEGMQVAIGGGGAWHSHDEGRNWLRRGDGLDPLVHAIHEHPEQRDRLFATASTGFFRSDDAGFSWIQSLGGLDRSWGGNFAIVPGAPDRLLLSVSRRPPGQDGALFRSANGGLTWSRIMLAEEDEWDQVPVVTRVWDSEDTLFVAAGTSIWGSHDGGKNWLSLADNVPVAHTIAAAL